MKNKLKARLGSDGAPGALHFPKLSRRGRTPGARWRSALGQVPLTREVAKDLRRKLALGLPQGLELNQKTLSLIAAGGQAPLKDKFQAPFQMTLLGNALLPRLWEWHKYRVLPFPGGARLGRDHRGGMTPGGLLEVCNGQLHHALREHQQSLV